MLCVLCGSLYVCISMICSLCIGAWLYVLVVGVCGFMGLVVWVCVIFVIYVYVVSVLMVGWYCIVLYCYVIR